MSNSMRRLRLVSEPNSSYKQPRGTNQKCSDAVLFHAFRDYFAGQTQETMIVVALNLDWHVVGYSEISRGKLNAVPLPITSIMQFMLLINCMDFVVLHNHPGAIEMPRPSQADVQGTMQLMNACGVMEMRLVDHIICGTNSYYSFKKNGLIK